MLFLLLSVICSVSVGVLFKISRNYNVLTTQIVTFNYVFALLLCGLFFSPDLTAVGATAPWSIYITIGILLPSVFLFLATSIKHIGIVKTDAAQRLSLFIPILASWLLFKEEFNMLKISAFLVAFPALLLILSKPTQNTKNSWSYAAVVLLGFGIIDILFKQIALYTKLPYPTSLFIVFTIALIAMIVIIGYEMILKKITLNLTSVLFGGLVGLCNFGNILFYLKAHKAFAENPSTVFAGMNMGVIIAGSVVGLLFFKEKLSTKNFLGLFFALVAIVLIVLSQTE